MRPTTGQPLSVHDGAILDFATDPTGNGFVSGGDDGKLNRVAIDGSISNIGGFGMKWVEHVATYAIEKGRGLIAASAGKIVPLFDQSGQILKELTHPSSVTGLVFDAQRQARRSLPL